MAKTEARSACLVLPNGDAGKEAAPVPTPERICIIDLGTNSFHAIIVDAYPNGTFKAVDRIKEMVRLGERGLTEGRLTEEAMGRALRALKRIRLLAEGQDVLEYLAFATSAIREAENGGDLILRARQEAGIDIQPISGAFEASLIYRGVRRAIDLPRPALLVDIGGGSAELIVGNGKETYYQTSLKIGAARMTERFITTDPVGRQEFRGLRSYYRSMLHQALEAARQHGVREVVGSSGTMENLARVCARQCMEKERSIFQHTFAASAFREATKQVMKSSRLERRAMPGIEAKRVDQVVAGAMLADIIVKDLGVEQVRISPHALREGIAEYFVEENYKRLGRIASFSNVRRRSVYEMAFRYRWEKPHARQVTALALQLFDACRSLHGLGETERELLEYAGLLHDVGYHVSRGKHHRHSLYLIKHAELRGFLTEEVDVMAHVARYHRGSLPNEKHKAFMALDQRQREVICRLAALLRLANGLDRSHFQNVTQLRTELSDTHLHLSIQTQGDPQLEVWAGRRGRDFFEKVYDRKVLLEATSEVRERELEERNSL